MPQRSILCGRKTKLLAGFTSITTTKRSGSGCAKKSAAPRNSRELAVRNQFFTPRYVVEFLVDNTLGRIWYEARKGDTTLKEMCHYLVRRPSECFLADGVSVPSIAGTSENLANDDFSQQPVYVPHRPKKDPRDLTILDPACGSGHFLLYSFDLLEMIYEEAWTDEHRVPSEITGRSIREDYPDLHLLHEAVPELIVRHNLHGIDIDLRALPDCRLSTLAARSARVPTPESSGIGTSNHPS